MPETSYDVFTVSELSFMSSDLRSGGPVYECLARVPLAAAAGR
jgi:2'-5' RNA ligase